MTPAPTGQPASKTAERRFDVQRVLLCRAVFEAPDPRTLSAGRLDWKAVTLDIRREIAPRVNSRRALILGIEVVSRRDGVPVLTASVDYMGTFDIAGYTDEEAEALLKTRGAEQVYPYAREMLLSMVSRSGLEQLGLPPVAFPHPDGR